LLFQAHFRFSRTLSACLAFFPIGDFGVAAAFLLATRLSLCLEFCWRSACCRCVSPATVVCICGCFYNFLSAFFKRPKMIIHVLDYGAGNVRSLLNALSLLGFTPLVFLLTSKPFIAFPMGSSWQQQHWLRKSASSPRLLKRDYYAPQSTWLGHAPRLSGSWGIWFSHGLSFHAQVHWAAKALLGGSQQNVPWHLYRNVPLIFNWHSFCFPLVLSH